MKTILRANRVPVSKRGRRKLEDFVETTFARLSERIHRIRVTLHDVNGLRGGNDILCRVEVVSSAGRIVIDETSDRPLRAVMGACLRATKTMWRRIDKLRSRRRRHKPDEAA